jgi:hypothetical protein
MLVTSSARRPPHLAELWRFRYLLRSLVVRNLKVKYQRSVLGFLWTLLNPVLTIAVLIAVFSYVVRMGMVHYWAFLLSGFFAWNFVAQMLYAGITILAEHATLRRSVAFPTELLIFGALRGWSSSSSSWRSPSCCWSSFTSRRSRRRFSCCRCSSCSRA